MKTLGIASINVLGIFAKQPIAGQVKTRLARDTSAEFAQRVAEACLADSLDRLAAVDARRVIAYAGSAAYFARPGYELFPQGDGDLGDRMRRFFDHFQRPGGKIVVVGSDSPTLPIAHVDQAYSELDTHDVVVGPSFDGGYYLIGSSFACPTMFNEIPWSTSKVMEATIEHLAGGRLALLPPWYDVDTADDWAMLRGHVLAMRRAGLDPGVPRVERLIREEHP